ncbi:Gfo/Idh/MocA family oxidoreductase [Mucilaginibacter mali]|uniref:Gfo/Idh/MocA family oxidoreductase n=1 Tax=Mucilaginibacter mali TaxID=2740462 RepID=A0A7D4Q4P4_9SPHI|nr:Gfo/Idh/MocA family oxidoreductase [Mucilaginibacter mali]QKJ31147.1 Gfo/Idh/MocA family oxidoreductase [Mucilaginibacter mali]
MSKKIRWGILSTAKIGRTQVIPAIQQCQYAEVTGIASGDKSKARQTAADLGIPKVYNDYQELLSATDIDAVYIPLPNHLHVDYTLQALAAGKHVLCEKPIGLNAADAQRLIDGAAQYPHLKLMEAFMYRFHPQWEKAKEIINAGLLGEVKHVQSIFSYSNMDGNNIRNRVDTGGGALMDIGCYCVSFPRYVFNAEPVRVMGLVHLDPEFKTDSLTSGLLDFGNGHTATLTCSTQLEPYQRINIIGSKGRLEIELPCNAHNDKPNRMFLQRDRVIEEIEIPVANQYALQVDAFSKAILDDAPVPTPLSDALGNMRVIDALFESGEMGEWVRL